MLCQRPVAGLAVDVRMLAGLLCVEHIAVAGLAGLVAGEVDRACGNLADRIPAVVPILSKAPRDDKAAHGQEDQEGDQKNRRESKQVSCILEGTHLGNPPP